MDIKIILGTIAAVLALVSSWVYIRDILRGNTKPHAYTWLIWSIVTVIAFLGQWVSGGGAGSWATGVAAIVTIGTFFLSLNKRYGSQDVTNFDKICLVLAVISIFPWILAKSVLWSVLLATAIDLIAFIPTLRKTWNAPKTESLMSMNIDSVKHVLSMLSMNTYSLVTLIYPAAVLFTKFLIVGEILIRRRNNS